MPLQGFELLGTLVKNIHTSLSGLFYLALPVAVIMAVVIGYFKSGSPDYIDLLKRTIVAVIILVAFPEISQTILDVCNGIAQKIDDMKGLETFLQMAQEKTQSYATAKNVLLLRFNDLIVAVISLLCFMILFIARFLMIAMYYFFWILLSALSPIFILFYIFPSTAYLTKNLFRGLIEVASWKILWAVLSAMLASTSLANIYYVEGNHITLIVLNLVVAIAMLLTPLIVRSIMGEGAQSAATMIGGATVAAVTKIPVRTKSLYNGTRQVASDFKTYGQYQYRKIRGKN